MNRAAARRRKRKLIVFFFVILGAFVFMDFQFRPVVKSISANRARMISAEIVNEAVLEDMGGGKDAYAGIVHLSKNESGEVLAISSDAYKVNYLKSHVSLLIQKKFSELKSKDLSIALGTLSGFELLNGKGPPIPLKIVISGSVLTDFKSNFSSSGINQTLHQIYISVHTRISVIVPGYSCVTELDTSVLVAETVIVGKVPNFFGGTAVQSMHGAVAEAPENGKAQ